MLPEPIGDDPCMLARRWVLAPLLAEGLIRLDRLARERFASSGLHWPGLWIVSGNRSKEAQADLNPAVQDSLHVECPALAADVRVGSTAGQSSESLLGFAGGLWQAMGFRWGGTFRDFPNPAHFDVGRVGARVPGPTGPRFGIEDVVAPPGAEEVDFTVVSSACFEIAGGTFCPGVGFIDPVTRELL